MPVIKPANPKTCKKAQEKKNTIKKIEKLAKDFPIIGILNMESLPAANLLRIKSGLKGKAEMLMTRKTLIELAIKNLKLANGEQLIEQLKGMPAVLFTKENPFSIYKIIKKSKSPAAAKPGQISPKDIVLPAGPTPFGPGPIISEFAMLGVKAGVEGGKVAIKADATIVKEGQTIKPEVASMLQKMGIEPMEIGMDLACVYENGVIYDKKVLDIDEDKFLADLVGSAQQAVNLAVEIGMPTKETIEIMLAKAGREATTLADEANFMAKGMEMDILAKAHRIATHIQGGQ
ncbi:50S ribosomal protein L10 [Candidatus Woesearchaeota archaeon]|nr:50S ribosomal protein L10 [Candidatus Woesearchaeota archaeon]